MQIKIDVASPQQQFISFEVTIPVLSDITDIYLPSWRPGRYQLGDFAKNIKSFYVFDDAGKRIAFEKISKAHWQVPSVNTEFIKVVYKYYAAELNAGSTYLDKTQLYVNPVNCTVFSDAAAAQPITISFSLPSHWDYAGPLKLENNCLKAKHFDEWADSPFIFSEQIQKQSFQVRDTTFHICFNGEVKPNWTKLLEDFELFADKQIEKFMEFPTSDYFFLFQILPYKIYHGVEHEQCTVIALGPSYAVFEELYIELLGVSSHELYHTWNVKAIRPYEMMPYDFKRENYTELGYLAEGVTTYMGDLMLYKSGVFDFKQYKIELEKQLQKHFDNFGRFNYSVAASSFDTWLDGYEAGAPGRKVSIYTEGCLIAFMLDVFLLRASEHQKSLDTVMRDLYFNFAKKGIGVKEEDFKLTIENYMGGSDLSWFFDQYIHGTKAYETLLMDCFEYLGLEIVTQPSSDLAAALLGLKLVPNPAQPHRLVVQQIYPGGPADLAGMMLNDEILGINDIAVTSADFSRWLKYFETDNKELTINRKSKVHHLVLPENQRTFYQQYKIEQLANPNKLQQSAFRAWSK
jgi:predicted metalloprotease with PDZ domain